jgi:3-methyladenine DNA glycosylase AlkD
MDYQTIIRYLKEIGDPKIAQHSQRYFKTGKGEYAQGDRFLGIRVPVLRKKVIPFKETSLKDIKELLVSPFHEVRLFALLLMVHQFSKGSVEQRDKLFNLYISSTPFINNWDLVDTSAPYIVGPYLLDRDRSILYDFARSDLLWERRISVMSTFFFVRQFQYEDTLRISRILLNDPHDLIHKAVGWMLREIGKRDRQTEELFLERHYQQMPKTMLRYAIEKFEKERRQMYLKGLI